MTVAKFTKERGLEFILVNGRRVYTNRISSLKKIGPGRWEGKANGTKFEIEGGKAAGGTKRDWFVEWAGWSKAIYCNSMVECVKLIEEC